MAYFFTPIPKTPICEDIEKECGARFPQTLAFWGDFDVIGLEQSRKYRPWLSDEEQGIIAEFIALFKEIFQSLNQPLTDQQKARIDGASRLSYMFSSAGAVNFPRDRRPKYLLDAVLQRSEERCDGTG